MRRAETSALCGRRASHAPMIVIISFLFGDAAVISSPLSAFAETRGEYVNRYVLLTDWINRSEIWVVEHLQDPGLCRVAHAIAERHVELASRMTPPPEFVSIHPHLLLVMENAERMFDYAANGDRSAFHRYRRIVHEEQRVIAELLQAEGHFMPVISPLSGAPLYNPIGITPRGTPEYDLKRLTLTS